MAVKEKIVGDVAVLAVSGKLWRDREPREVHEKVKLMITKLITTFR